jgi:hypothetical protein
MHTLRYGNYLNSVPYILADRAERNAMEPGILNPFHPYSLNKILPIIRCLHEYANLDTHAVRINLPMNQRTLNSQFAF